MIRKKKLLARLRSLFYSSVYSKPDFLIIGAMKSGTTSLFHYISNHSKIIPPEYKEPAFFAWHQNKGYNWYLSKFPNRIKKLNKLTFEATPLYLYFPETPSKIKTYLPNVKLIIVLRNPIERAYSHWNFYNNSDYVNETEYRLNNLKDKRDFETAINEELKGVSRSDVHAYLKIGYYLEQINRYLMIFERKQILFLDFEELKTNLPNLMQKVCEFLEIKNEYVNTKYSEKKKKYEAVIDQNKKSSTEKNNFAKYNTNKYDLNISDELYDKLIAHFKFKNKGLNKLVDIDFSWNKHKSI